MPMKRALIFGVTGQDGSYLAELLLSKGYKVVGVNRRTSSENTNRINHLLENRRFYLVQGDVTDALCVQRIVQDTIPHEIYNLAAQSHVWTSFDQPLTTWDITGKGCLNILEVIRNYSGRTPKFYQASSSEMFGDSYDCYDDDCEERFQDEHTVMNPQSPYAIAKLAAYNATRLYRSSYGIYACNGILFNHESERRGDNFLTKKVSRYVSDLYIARQEGRIIPKLQLGNLRSMRDWGHAEDYVYAMWLMMQCDHSNDYVISTGHTHTVEEYVIEAFKCINIYEYQDYVEIDKKLYRPSEVPYLRGDYTKAQMKLDWEPRISFKRLVKRMVNHDIQNRLKYNKSKTTVN